MKTFPIVVFLAGVTWACASPAQDSNAPRIFFDAYGTLGLVYSSEDQADFVANLLQAEGAGHTSEVNPKVDSRLGLQATVELTSRLSSVVQVVIEQEPDGDFRPGVEWANLKYDFTPDFSIRVGRMVQPTFMVSEYRKVGYATPWVRPPEEVYRMTPVSNFDGIDFSYRHRFGKYLNTLRGIFGRSDTEIGVGGEFRARDVLVFSNTLEWDDFLLFASVGRYRLTFEEVNPLFNAFRQFGPEGDAIANRYDADGKQVTILTAGARYDPGDWFVMGELGDLDTRTFLGNPRGAYITGGYRIGAFTPYASIARIWNGDKTSDPGLSTGGLPPSIAATAGQLNFELNELLASAVRQKTLALGTRWDFARNMALTMQYEYLDLSSGSPGAFINIQPDFRLGGSASVVSLTLDFVF